MSIACTRLAAGIGLVLAGCGATTASAAGADVRYLCTLPDGSVRSFAQNLGEFHMSIGQCQRQEVPSAPQPRPTWVEAQPMQEVRTIEARIKAPPRDLLMVPEGIAHWMREACRRHGINPSLATAVMYVESRFHPDARSPRGALGLMQVMRSTGSRYGVYSEAKLLDPQTNIEIGVRHLRTLLEMFPGRIDLAVAAYNAGEGAVVKHGYRVPPYAETQQYVEQVMTLLHAVPDHRKTARSTCGPPVCRGNAPGDSR